MIYLLMKETKNTSKVTLQETEKFSIFSKWTIRKIVFVAILIAVAIVFTIIGTQLLPVVSIPTIKISFIGLPVKITGFIFGPIIGFFVGLVSDLLSMLFIPPTSYNPLYTLATGMNGLVSGIVGWLFLKFIKFYFGGEFRNNSYRAKIFVLTQKYNNALEMNDLKNVEKYANLIILTNNKMQRFVKKGATTTIMNINLITALILGTMLIIFITYIIGFVVPDSALNKGVLTNRWFLLVLMLGGFGTMIIFLLVARFVMKPSRYLIIVPIIIFSAILEFVNTPIISIADNLSLGTGNIQDVFIWVFTHIVTSPLKIWFNLLIIYFSYSVISSLVYKNDNLAY